MMHQKGKTEISITASNVMPFIPLLEMRLSLNTNELTTI
jgi:hypothetical protein